MKYARPYKLISFLFKHTLGRLPYYRRYTKEINVIGNSHDLIRNLLQEERKAERFKASKPTLLDIGARQGEMLRLAEGYEYHGFDVDPKSSHILIGDICACPEIADNSFDVVLSIDVFEHVKRPWDAALECVRICKPGGLIIHRTVFSYRYHPSPIDYWRFSAQGLEYLFNDSGQVDTLVSGYDLRVRRRDARGNPVRMHDRPPIDYLGGFRENWRSLYIGRKHIEK